MIVKTIYNLWLFMQILKKFNFPKGREVKKIILDENFWRNCLIMEKTMGSLICLLQICDSNEIYRAHKWIKEMFKRKKHLYKSCTSIMKERWSQTLCTGKHVLAYWLNPTFQFDDHNLCQKLKVQ